MANDSVLDACALLAFFYGENGADVVESRMQAAEQAAFSLFMHKINFLEVYYKILSMDAVKAELVYSTVLKLPVTLVSEISDDVLREAARLKVQYRISLADSIALAEASVRNADILTCDHHEFDPIAAQEKITFAWIR